MNEWKDKLRNSEFYKEGVAMKKKCQDCGNEFTPKEQHYKVCDSCNKKRKGGSGGTDRQGVKLSDDYLKKGYFDDEGKYLRASIFKEEANVLAMLRMTPTSLRAFYNKLKAIENKYKNSNNNFDSVKPAIYAFERDVAYQVSRGVVSEEFRKFINKNAEMAVKGPRELKGFVEHFLSVLSYFKDVSK